MIAVYECLEHSNGFDTLLNLFCHPSMLAEHTALFGVDHCMLVRLPSFALFNVEVHRGRTFDFLHPVCVSKWSLRIFFGTNCFMLIILIMPLTIYLKLTHNC